MKKTVLDQLDMKILSGLSKNSRISYNSLGKKIGLTAKSIRARIKNMQSNGVLIGFDAIMNWSILGYTKFYLLTLRVKQGDQHVQGSLRLLGDIVAKIDGLGGVSMFLLAIRAEAEEKFDRLVEQLGQDLFETQTIMIPLAKGELTRTDFKIISCLLDNPRMEISNIADQITMSLKTVARRLNKIIENNFMTFSVHANIVAFRGYIVSVIFVKCEKEFSLAMLEDCVADIEDAFFIYIPWFIQRHTASGFYFTRDVFVLDSIIKKIESSPGVKKVILFFPTLCEYYNEEITKFVQKKLS